MKVQRQATLSLYEGYRHDISGTPIDPDRHDHNVSVKQTLNLFTDLLRELTKEKNLRTGQKLMVTIETIEE